MTSDYSLADIKAVTDGNDNGFGGNNGWWIILFFLLCGRGGWGNWGGYGDNGGGIPQNYALTTDFATIERKIDGVYSGICDSTYALNNGIQNGFAAAQNTMTQGFAGLNTGMIQQGYEGRIATQAVGNQLNQCCCDLRSDLAGINYNLATQATGITNAVNSGFCETNRGMERGFAEIGYNAATNATAIIQNQHSDTDRVIAKLNEMEATRQQEKIAQLTAENQGLRFEASQAAQNNYLVSQLSQKCPTPAYMVANPNGPLNYTVSNGCGCGGCGC